MDSDSAGTTTLATYSIAVPEGMSAAAAAAKLTGIESALALRLQEPQTLTSPPRVTTSKMGPCRRSGNSVVQRRGGVMRGAVERDKGWVMESRGRDGDATVSGS